MLIAAAVATDEVMVLVRTAEVEVERRAGQSVTEAAQEVMVSISVL